MADPKYQNLPYIAIGEPDVYETGDLPEADQALQEGDEETVVERLLVDPKTAFKRFNKATVDTTGTNFSGGPHGGRAGYTVHYEVVPSNDLDSETLLQRLQRLKCELSEIEDLAKTNFNEPDVNPASVLNEIEILQKQIDNFTLPAIASPEHGAQAYSQLLTQLKSVPQKGSPKRGESSHGKQDTTTFELSYMPDLSHSSKEASLEARITQLEKLIGEHSGDSNPLSEGVAGQSVMDSVANLSSKMHLLDENKIDKLSARLQVLLQSLNKVSESGAVGDAHNLEKVNELYELVKKWDETSDSLPTIVDRLYILQDLHQQAMEFSSSLKALESAQAELTQNIKNHNQLLTDVHITFTQNVDAIKSNVENLEKRMNALNK